MQTERNQRCTAKSKRSELQCKNRPVTGKKVCRMHGGKSTGPSKGSQNALIHGAYSGQYSETDIDIHNEAKLDNLDDEIRRCAVLEYRGFAIAQKATTDEHLEFGLKFAGDAQNRARKLKLTRQELLRAKESDDNKPLPWVD